jgi:hypothetical protein
MQVCVNIFFIKQCHVIITGEILNQVRILAMLFIVFELYAPVINFQKKKSIQIFSVSVITLKQ